MIALSLLGLMLAQPGDDAPRVPDQKVTSYELLCHGISAKISFAERFRSNTGVQPIVRSVALLQLGSGKVRSPNAAAVKRVFERIAYFKSVVTSCKGDAAWFVLDYIAQNDFREAVANDRSVNDTAPVGRLYLTVPPTGIVNIEDALPKRRQK